jgi:hypothetical protein
VTGPTNPAEGDGLPVPVDLPRGGRVLGARVGLHVPADVLLEECPTLSSRLLIPYRLCPLEQGRCRRVLLSFRRSFDHRGRSYAGIMARQATSSKASDQCPTQLLVSRYRACSLKNPERRQVPSTLGALDPSNVTDQADFPEI